MVYKWKVALSVPETLEEIEKLVTYLDELECPVYYNQVHVILFRSYLRGELMTTSRTSRPVYYFEEEAPARSFAQEFQGAVYKTRYAPRAVEAPREDALCE